MADNSTLLTVAGAAILVAFAIAALLYVRAVNTLMGFLRERGYTDFGARRSLARDPRFLSDRLVSRACLGVGVREIADEEYRLLLSAVRKPLLVCFALFAVFVIGLGSFTHGPQ